MKTFVAPNGRVIYIPEGRIMTCGLSPEENEKVKESLISDEYELYIVDDIRDTAAINKEALIINAAALTEEDRGLIVDCYTELSGCFDESVFWIGYPKPPSHLRAKFFCYENFGQLCYVLPEKLVKAHRKVKKSRAFSKNLADCLRILSLIRSKPGIKTQELSEKLELPVRTVQRHIAALQAAGEWIEYDTKKRGWQLQYGISVLFGDYLTPEVLEMSIPEPVEVTD